MPQLGGRRIPQITNSMVRAHFALFVRLEGGYLGDVLLLPTETAASQVQDARCQAMRVRHPPPLEPLAYSARNVQLSLPRRDPSCGAVEYMKRTHNAAPPGASVRRSRLI